VASLIAAKGTAEAALLVAREAVKVTGAAAAGAARVTAFAAKNNGQLLMIEAEDGVRKSGAGGDHPPALPFPQGGRRQFAAPDGRVTLSPRNIAGV
jgi:hypothetical protein